MISKKIVDYKENIFPVLMKIDLQFFLSQCKQENLLDEKMAKFIYDQLNTRIPYISIFIDKRFCIEQRELEF
jgi:hypothetical protein